MADPGNKKEIDANVLNRLASRGEDALTRVMDELGKNPRVTDALGKAMDAKGKVDTTTRKTLGQVGLAAAGEIGELRARLERLEKRLSAMEGSGSRRLLDPDELDPQGRRRPSPRAAREEADDHVEELDLEERHEEVDRRLRLDVGSKT